MGAKESGETTLIIRLRPEQVPQLWEAIKLMIHRSQEVTEKAFTAVCIHVLHSLLCETLQCVVVLDDTRTVIQMFLTCVREDKFSGKRQFVIRGIYSWRLMEGDNLARVMELFRTMAKNQQCSEIFTSSSHPRIQAFCQQLGFKEFSRNYTHDMEETDVP